MNTLIEFINKNSIITTKDVEKLGYGRHILSLLTNEGKLERLKNGVYQKSGQIIDDFILISSNNSRVVFSHNTALYLHNLSDRTPNIFHISVPQGYNASHIKNTTKNIHVHYIKKELYDVGITNIKTPLGNMVPVYDRERTMCDIVKGSSKIDKQIFLDGINRYFKSKNKNLRKIVKYSKLFNIETEIRKYIEVLSWLILKV